MPGNDSGIIITPHQALQLGWSIIPITNHKMPMITSWKPYQTRRPTLEEVDAWLTKHPAGWAIVTGSISQRFTLDFDGEQGHITIQTLKLIPHRITPSGGYHVDFAYPGWPITTLNGKVKMELGKRWPGMDIRGDGGYAGFAGQMAKGKYAWLRIPEAYDVNVLPAELVQFLKTAPPAELHHANGAPPAPDPDRLIRMAFDRIPSHGRNASGFWLAGQLRDNRYSSDEAWPIMLEYASQCPKTNSKGQPEEYTESEIAATLKQIFGHAPRQAWTALEKTPEPDVKTPSKAKKHFSVLREKEDGKDPGVYFADDETGSKIFICSVLNVVAKARDINSDNWGLLLRWKDPAGKEHSWIAPAPILYGQPGQFRETLAGGGLEMSTNPKTDHLLTQYVRSQTPERDLMHSVPHVGWFEKVFVFPDCTIPRDANVGYQSAGRGEHFYRSKGTLDSWRQNVAKPCQGNSRLVFAMSVSFAGALLRLLNVQGGGFHFFGSSSIGKSTTQWVAGSVWGGGGRNGFARTWAATKNAVESIAEMHNDGCTILDEIRMIEPREAETISYMISNGLGKARENRTMTGRRTLEWQCMILSSGEIQLSDCAALAGQQPKGGAEIRLAPIPADAGKDMGIFENLNGSTNSRIFAETLEAEAKMHYGTAAPVFIQYIIDHWDEIVIEGSAYIETHMSELREELPDAPGEVLRVLRRFLTAGYAGELSIKAGITGWSEDDATTAAIKCFRAWIMNRGGWESTDVLNGIRRIRHFIATQHNRFRNADPGAEERFTGSSSVGYFKKINDELIYLFEQDAFKKDKDLALASDSKAILHELIQRKVLYRNERPKLTCRADVTDPTGEPRKGRFYGVKASILDLEE